jgi:hypothetical protein
LQGIETGESQLEASLGKVRKILSEKQTKIIKPGGIAVQLK